MSPIETKQSPFQVGGKHVRQKLIEELKNHSSFFKNPTQLRKHFKESGYLYLREILNRSDVESAKREVLEKLINVYEIEKNTTSGIATGTSKRLELEPDLGLFWKSVSECTSLRLVTHGTFLAKLASSVFGSLAIAFDLIYLRVCNPGRFTHIHCDYPFFTRFTEKVMTMWIPLCDIPAELGPIFFVKGSHKFKDHLKATKGFDLMKQKNRKANLLDHPAEYAAQRETTLLTADFKAGDVLLFNMYIQHGSFQNYSQENRVRVTTDVRFQPVNDPKDPRYFGDNPLGPRGGGYGDLNGAKPLDQPWEMR